MHNVYIAGASDFELSIGESHRHNLCLNLECISFAFLLWSERDPAHSHWNCTIVQK